MKTSRSLLILIAFGLAFVTLLTPTSARAGVPVLLINEIDSDTPSDDVAEFVELYDGGVGNTALDGYIVVFFNGSDDLSYASFDLDGKSTDANGFFLLGNTGVIGTPGNNNLDIGLTNVLQNGADAVALYAVDTPFPNGTAPTTADLVDALVYDTADPDDAGLLILLNASQPQVDEASGGDVTNDSIGRCPDNSGGARNTDRYLAQTPSPGASNNVNCPDPNLGACCLIGGGCVLMTSTDCATASGIFQGAGVFCGETTCDGITGACCSGASCSQQLRENCQAAGLIFLGEGVSCTGACPPNYSGLFINEIRTQQPGADTEHFFEIYNSSASTRSLNGLSYVVIGDDLDAPQPSNSGFIEEVIELSGHSIPAGGFFLVAEDADTFGAVANKITGINFEDSDNLTHLLVSGFYGTNGQDLDTPSDCVLDAPQPWAAIVDRVALIQQSNPPTTTECHYGLNGVPPNTIGPDGSFVPAHCSRIPNGSTAANAWVFLAEFDPALANDTPGASNALATGACCEAGSFCSAQTRTQCVDGFGGIWKGRDVPCDADNDMINEACEGACCYCADADPAYCEAYACTVTDPDTCAGLGGGTGVFQGNQIPCPPDAGSIDCSECLTIADARARFELFNPPANPPTPRIPVPVRICNVRLSSKTSLVNNPNASYAIQDLSGADGQSGLTIFGTAALLSAQFGSVNEGDRIDVQGTLIDFNGLMELSNNNLRALALVHNYGDNQPVVPIVVPGSDFTTGNPLAEQRESELVTIECVAFVSPPGPNFAGSTNYTINTGPNNLALRVSTNALDYINSPIPTGMTTITGILGQFDSTVPQDSNYQLAPRKLTDFNNSPANCGPTAACCGAGGTCRNDLNESLCNGSGGYFNPGDATCPPATPCLTVDDVRINEIRMDQPSTDLDEYFELKGTPNTPLGSLTYVVIGDGTGSSGVIEAFRRLTSEKIPADGHYLATSTTYTLGGSPDDQSTFLNFENDDNTTHMIVENFTGATGQDLDTPDDGVLNTTPWLRIVDSVAVVKQLNPVPNVDGNEYYYSATTVGPEGTTSPSHVAICPLLNQWQILPEDPLVGSDTPGTANPAGCACGSCAGDINNDGLVNGKDIKPFTDALLFGPVDGCADITLDSALTYADVGPFANLVLSGSVCGGLGAPTGTRIVTYNLLNYSGSSARNAAFKKLTNAMQADVIIAQEVNGSGGASGFLTNVLNAADGPGGYAMAEFTDGPDTDNALYYRTIKLDYTNGNHVVLATALRNVDRWFLSHDGQGAAGQFYVYSAHLRAGQGQTNVDARAAEAAIMRADANALPGGSRFIYAGDFNLYNGNIADLPDNPAETAWGNLTAVGAGRGNDPISQIGIWHANGAFDSYHTQSPHNDNPGAPGNATGGGMDDRFDFMLVSDNMLGGGSGLKYLTGTYKAYGQDGNHLNLDINDPPTIPEGTFIADQLHSASDHLPVVMEVRIVP
ncbi:MAG TPA: DUF5689 domain-containing protein [Phycisphaerae bacterium]|nr:DUF5689 domain-containing protein [Phycisphaerae bacterium]